MGRVMHVLSGDSLINNMISVHQPLQRKPSHAWLGSGLDVLIAQAAGTGHVPVELYQRTLEILPNFSAIDCAAQAHV